MYVFTVESKYLTLFFYIIFYICLVMILFGNIQYTVRKFIVLTASSSCLGEYWYKAGRTLMTTNDAISGKVKNVKNH